MFLPDSVDDLLYDDETSDAFEIGSKEPPGEGRATLNTALYYQTFDGYLGFVRGVRVLNNLGQPVDLPGGIVFNGDANIWGWKSTARCFCPKPGTPAVPSRLQQG